VLVGSPGRCYAINLFWLARDVLIPSCAVQCGNRCGSRTAFQIRRFDGGPLGVFHEGPIWGELQMSNVVKIAKRFFNDEKAAEVTELGIVLALIVALSIAAIGVIGGEVSEAYSSVEAELQ
jgi:Flp pilus assembly pilin Flp